MYARTSTAPKKNQTVAWNFQKTGKVTNKPESAAYKPPTPDCPASALRMGLAPAAGNVMLQNRSPPSTNSKEA
jgi:hypothetical protein